MIELFAGAAYLGVGIVVNAVADRYVWGDDKGLSTLLIVMWPVVLVLVALFGVYKVTTRSVVFISARFNKELPPPVSIKRYRVGSWRKK